MISTESILQPDFNYNGKQITKKAGSKNANHIQ